MAHVPDNLPLEHAAGLPLVALTAWQALQQAKPKAGQRVVINAASGGVGHVAVQVRAVLDEWLIAGGIMMWQPATCLFASFVSWFPTLSAHSRPDGIPHSPTHHRRLPHMRLCSWPRRWICMLSALLAPRMWSGSSRWGLTR